MLSKHRLLALASLVLAGCAGVGPAAFAAPETEPGDRVSVAVPYADLNLDNQSGAETMLRRLTQASRSVCGPRPSDPLDYQTVYRSCVRKVLQTAVDRLDSPLVTAAIAGDRLAGKVEVASAKP